VHAQSRARRQRGTTALAALVALALGAAACSGGSGNAADDERPTFSRAGGSSLGFDEPAATVSDLVAPAGDGEPWTIVGSLYDPGENASLAAVWHGDDARDWKRETIRPSRRGRAESLAAAVPTDGGELLAVGRVGDGSSSDAAVWVSDGDDWHESRSDAMGGEHEQWAFDVAKGDGGILVAGGESVWGEVRPRMWFSPDGETWTTVDGGAGGVFDATGEESVRDIAAFGSGFVAVGSRTVDNDQDAVAWYSADGQTWEQIDAPTLTGPGRQELDSVVATTNMLVAGGYSAQEGGQALPISWRSPDGRTWEAPSAPLPLNDDPRQAATDLTIRSLTFDDQGILAAGGSEWRPHVWRSTDGVNWATLQNPVHGGLFEDGVELEDAITAFGQTVALGAGPAVLVLKNRWEDATGDSFPTGGRQPFATSVAETPDVTIAGGGEFTAATGSNREKYTGQIWMRDGGDWTPVNSDDLAPGQIMDVVPFSGGFAAVGIEDFGVASGRKVVSADPLPDGIAWVSADGKRWTRIGAEAPHVEVSDLEALSNPDPNAADVIAQLEAEAPPRSVDPAGGDGTRSLSAAAAVGKGFVAVGVAYQGGDADPIVISSDGNAITGENSGIGGPGIQRFNDVCANPDGVAVAVGVAGTTGGYDATAARRDASGAWQPATASDGSFGGPGSQLAYACAASEDGFVMVGSNDSSGDTDARVWTSKDGLTWAEVMASPLGGGGDQWASAVAANPGHTGGWLVGGTDTAGGDGDIALWRISAKGEVERRDRGERSLGGPGEQTVTGITIDDHGHVTLAGDDYGRAGLWESDVLDR
jgi:hypothetical protein